MSFESPETVDCVELTAVDTALRLEDISDDIATVSLWMECTLSVRVEYACSDSFLESSIF